MILEIKISTELRMKKMFIEIIIFNFFSVFFFFLEAIQLTTR